MLLASLSLSLARNDKFPGLKSRSVRDHDHDRRPLPFFTVCAERARAQKYGLYGLHASLFTGLTTYLRGLVPLDSISIFGSILFVAPYAPYSVPHPPPPPKVTSSVLSPLRLARFRSASSDALPPWQFVSSRTLTLQVNGLLRPRGTLVIRRFSRYVRFIVLAVLLALKLHRRMDQFGTDS